MNNLKISILNVEHGDFSVIKTPFNQYIIIDCGSGTIVPHQFLKNISTIDELQISHPHTDHFDDIVELSKKKIKSFICPNINLFEDSIIGWRGSDKIKIKHLRSLYASCERNDIIQNRLFYRIFYFPKDIDSNDPNSASIVTLFYYSGFKMLFGGDLPDKGWKSLIKTPGFIENIKDLSIYKVSHHGRKEGISLDLFKYINPNLCIISDKPIDSSNSNTESTKWYTQRSIGAKIYGIKEKRKVLTTRNDGSIFISINNDGKWCVHTNTNWI